MALLLTLALCVLGCDTAEVPPAFDPDSVDYDAVGALSYSEYVQPLLAARDAFAPAASEGGGALDAYAWEALFESEAGAAIVPFDAEGSDLVRFVEDLPEDAAIPYPNLRRLQADELRYLKRWIEAGAPNDAGAVPYADAEHLLFACVQGENHVAVIDAARRRVIRRVYFDDHGLPSAPYGPHHVVFEPDGGAWTVSLISAGAVAKLRMDLAMDPSDPAYLLAASEPGAFTTPGMMALDAAAGRLYVGRSTLSSASTYGIGVFDATTLAPLDEFALPGYDVPHALGLAHGGRFLLTAPLSGREALTLDAATGDVVSEATVGAANHEMVHFNVLPDGATATLTVNGPGGTSEVRFFRVGADGALTAAGAVPTGARAWHAHLDTDGRTVLVPNRAGNSVTLVDVPTQAVRLTAENAAAGGPLAMPHSPAPRYGGAFFVSSSNLQGTWEPPHRFLGAADGDGVRAPLPAEAFGNVAVLDEMTGQPLAVIPLGRYPSGLEHYHGGGHGHDHGRHGGEHHEEEEHDGHH